MRGGAALLMASLLVYVGGVVLDFATTAYMLSLGCYAEANPNLAPIAGTSDHVAREVAMMLIVAALTVSLFLAMRRYGLERRVTIVPLLPAAMRWSAALHNLILLLTGWESPLIYLPHPRL